jgi:carboxylesterase type B
MVVSKVAFHTVTELIPSGSSGIPFAEPPVSGLRLRPPVLKTRLNASKFDASQYGKGCVPIVCSVFQDNVHQFTHLLLSLPILLPCQKTVSRSMFIVLRT